MNKLSLTIPGFSDVPKPSGLNPNITDVGSFLSPLLSIAFFIAAFMAFYWLVWAAFQYILASGKKEELAKARERIRWTLIGLVVVFAAYFMARFASEIFPTQFGKGGLPF